MSNKEIKIKRVGNLVFTKRKGKQIAVLIGRGQNCQCVDCPVLYGYEACPFDKPKKK